MDRWLDGVQQEDEAPTEEQLAVLHKVAERVLQEFRLEHEGLLLAQTHPDHMKAETPLHIQPKQEWIRRRALSAKISALSFSN